MSYKRTIISGQNLDRINSLSGQLFEFILGGYIESPNRLYSLSNAQLLDVFENINYTGSKSRIFWAPTPIPEENESLFNCWNKTTAEETGFYRQRSGFVFIKATHEEGYLMFLGMNLAEGHVIGLTRKVNTVCFIPFE
jgi:hypothetical protein